MKFDIVSVGSFQKKLEFDVPAVRLKEELDRAYRDLSTKARIAGFRKGKVPRKVLESRFGPRVKADVANILVQEGYSSAIEEHKLEPIGSPKLTDSGELDAEQGFRFSITVEVKPDVRLESYKGIEVVFPSTEVSDAEVDRLVKATLESRAKLEEVADRPIRKGDLVLVELVAKDGETELARELGTMIRTDGDPYYPGVESLLEGLSVGEEKSGVVKFGAQARNDAVKDRELDVSIKVISVQALQVPDLSDAVATELGYEGGVEGLRTAVQLKAQQDREPLARNQARANLLQALIAANPFEVPTSMVESHLQMLIEELRLQTAFRRGGDPRRINFSPAQIADLRVRGEFAAKGGLILDYVARTEALAVTDEDIEAKYQEIADQRSQSIEAIRGYFVKEGAVEELRARLLEEKTLDWLLEQSKLVTGSNISETVSLETESAPEPEMVAESVAAEAEEMVAELAPPPVEKPKRTRKKKTDAE